MLGLRLRVHDVLWFSTKNSTNDRIISTCGDLLARFAFSRQPAGNGRPTPSLCASHSEVSGRLGTRNLTKCESKFPCPQSSPSKSCNDLSRTVPCPESLLI